MKTQPLVSIITPTYNHEKFIRDCIESVLQQTYREWEQVIIDDGSTDRTAEIVRSIGDSRIRYIHQENKGIEALPHTYNRALGTCSGDLVAILEGDDIWPPEKLSSLLPSFLQHNVVLAYGAVADVAANGKWSGRLGRSVRKRMQLPKRILCNDPPGTATRYMLRADGVDLVPPSTVVIRRAALDSIGGFQYCPGLCVTDFPTFVRLSLAGNFYYRPEVMGYRRRHSGSATFNNLMQIQFRAHEFVQQLLHDRTLSVSVADQVEIEDTWKRSKARLEFTAGRVSLAREDWRAARGHFVQALSPRSPRVLLPAVAGWCLSWLRCDLEGLFSVGGIANLSETDSATAESPISVGLKDNGGNHI
jgi:hypothetical protein